MTSINKVLMEILVKVLPLLISMLSPVIKELMVEMVHKLEAAAKETDNPVDDVLVNALKELLGVS